MNKYKIVEIEWLDAQSGFSQPLTLEELEKEDPYKTYSTGYLIKEDKEKVILGFMMFIFGGTKLLFESLKNDKQLDSSKYITS